MATEGFISEALGLIYLFKVQLFSLLRRLFPTESSSHGLATLYYQNARNRSIETIKMLYPFLLNAVIRFTRFIGHLHFPLSHALGQSSHLLSE